MLQQDETKQAAEYLRQVIPLLSQNKLAPTPINYSIFYCYLSGCSQALNDIVDSFISEKKPFTVLIMLELYEKFVNGGAAIAQQEKIHHSIEKVISDASEEVLQINNTAGEFDNTISKHAETLSTANDPQTTALVLQQIMQDTRNILKENQVTQARIEETSAEIIQIKAELEEVKASAEKDSLTGLKNRGTFDKRIDDIVYTQKDPNTTLIILDIDHFKRINDNFGHLVGDRVIRYVSALLNQIIGPDHHIARYGGEEFAVILTGVPINDAKQLTEKTRVAMCNSKLQRKDSRETIGKVTLSAGIAILKPDDSVDSFIERADKALYKAKKSGRNKVIISE